MVVGTVPATATGRRARPCHTVFHTLVRFAGTHRKWHPVKYVGCCLLGSVLVCGCAPPTDPGFRLSPCPDVGGPTMVFSALAPEETTDLYALNAAGKFERLFTDGLSFQPEFSPDGRSVLFIRNNEGENFDAPNPVKALLSLDLLTGAEEVITRASGPSSARWAPNGSDIVLTVRDRDGRGRLNVAASGGEPQPVTTVPRLPEGFVVALEEPSAWSPDGKRLAFQRVIMSPDGTDEASLVVLNLDTRAEEILPGEFSFIGDLAWSPDGQSLLFSDRLQDPDPLLRTRGVLSLDLRTSEMRILAQQGADPSYVGDDSSLIAYSVERIDDPDGALAGIVVLDRNSGETYPLATVQVDPNTRLSTASCVVVDGRG